MQDYATRLARMKPRIGRGRGRVRSGLPPRRDPLGADADDGLKVETDEPKGTATKGVGVMELRVRGRGQADEGLKGH